MRILFLGDIVGPAGLAFVKRALPAVIAHEKLDLVIANAENCTKGSGLTPQHYQQLREAGIDLITLGDHAYKRMEIAGVLQNDERICRPANWPSEAPGRDFAWLTTGDGVKVAAFALLGRTFMKPADCPFKAADRVLAQLNGQASVIFCDMHAEATADKYLMLHHLKGRVSAVLGTHTHVPTADEQIFAPGTAFISDVGMTGPYDSILGRRIDRVLSTAVTFVPSPFDVATGDPRLGGVIVEVEPTTGRSLAICRYKLGEIELAALNGQTQPPDGASGG